MSTLTRVRPHHYLTPTRPLLILEVVISIENARVDLDVTHTAQDLKRNRRVSNPSLECQGIDRLPYRPPHRLVEKWRRAEVRTVCNDEPVLGELPWNGVQLAPGIGRSGAP